MLNKIEENRSSLNLTQEELAEKVNIPVATLDKIENKKLMPSILLALKISLVLKTEVEKIFILEDTD